MTTCVRVETAMFSFHPMLPRVRVLPPEELAPPPPQPASTSAATATARTSVKSLLPTFIYLPSSASSFRDAQAVLTSANQGRIKALARGTSRRSCRTPLRRRRVVARTLARAERREGSPASLHTAGDAVEYDGEDHDADPPDEAKADVELSEPLQHRNPEPPGPGQRGYDDHRKREHDDLVDPGHDRPQRERELNLEQGLPGGRPEGVRSLHPAVLGRDYPDGDAYDQAGHRRREDERQGDHRLLPQPQADDEHQP